MANHSIVNPSSGHAPTPLGQLHMNCAFEESIHDQNYCSLSWTLQSDDNPGRALQKADRHWLPNRIEATACVITAVTVTPVVNLTAPQIHPTLRWDVYAITLCFRTGLQRNKVRSIDLRYSNAFHFDRRHR
jgi:hypothetical protein